MTRRRSKHDKRTKLEDKAFEPADFSYWDPYYVDSEIVQRYKRNIEEEEAFEAEVTTVETTASKPVKQHLGPAIALTAIFGALFVILPCLVKKGPNRGWVTIYIGQMNPLMGPRLENTTVAWIAHKLGNQVVRGNSSSSD
ncbi:uncharacterized protein LOC123695382 isoform X2 [Colias croceus]|uniref:uncharacterized protein LOC123695382 isoform X2 n=1 Tax=Colias crocea TaxID=72248 RepID=UPI001E27D9D3|nr:uncharacterized protein LOC123695382 isoform X2 [Colias croceus]